MNITISNAEADVLRGVIDTTLGDLGIEIRHTDSPPFRAELRARREALRSVRDQLAAVAAA